MSYFGHHPFNAFSINLFAHTGSGVYYCGYINEHSQLVPLYIGRAAGLSVSVKSRLLDHLRDQLWDGITHFGYTPCSPEEAVAWEAMEIKSRQPYYNKVGK